MRIRITILYCRGSRSQFYMVVDPDHSFMLMLIQITVYADADPDRSFIMMRIQISVYIDANPDHSFLLMPDPDPENLCRIQNVL